MSTDEFQSHLYNLVDELIHGGDVDEVKSAIDSLDLQRVNTFDQAGVLSGNNGLVVKLKDGSEFQLTIVKSR